MDAFRRFGVPLEVGEEQDNSLFVDDEPRFSGGRLFGIDGLSPHTDVVVSRQLPNKLSPSPSPGSIGDRGSDSFPVRSPLFGQWDQPSSPSSSTTPPQHINNLFGFSNPFGVGVLPKKPNANMPKEELSFTYSAMKQNLEATVQPSIHAEYPRSGSFVSPSPSLEDDLFDMDPVTEGQFSENHSPQNSLTNGSSQNMSSQAEAFTPTFGEHPLGEHPSRTLFVRNINSNVDDEELNSLFEQYGPIRTMYTQCKHRGFVMISYYDIRHAKNAMRYLQGKVLRRRKLDIHYSIPKDNPSEKDQNQGTLVVFNLEPSTMNEELKQVFGAFGEIKEIRETPNKKHHKFIEFYDIRDADRAMKALNKTEIKGKKIKIEPSRPGGARKNMMNQIVFEHPVSASEEDHFTAQSLPFMHDDDDLSQYGPSTNSYPPVQQPLPKYIPGAPLTLSPPQHGTTSPNFRSSRSRSHSITSPTDSPPNFPSVAPVSRSSSSSSIQSVWMGLGSTQQLEPSPKAFSPSPVGMDNRNRTGGFSPNSGFLPATDQIVSPNNRDVETRRHRSQSIEDDRFKFILALDRVLSGEDMRTTLMIKNIPNKYSQKMLLATVDDKHKGTYDFFYLPIDFKNKCNVGYAFINFVNPVHIITFYEELNNKKWEKFNSEKVCELTYARIQGKSALIAHFQNSSLMCEDKKCRPIIFHSDGPNVGEQEPFPVNHNYTHSHSPRNRSLSNSSRDTVEDDPRM